MAATLALDLGTATGWALARPDGRLEWGRQPFGLDGHEREGARFHRFRAWLNELKGRVDRMNLDPLDHGLTRVLYEKVDFIVPGQAYAAHIWGGMWGQLTSWCEHHGIVDYHGVAPSTIKKAATGNGRAQKPDMIKAVNATLAHHQCVERRTIYDHNTADALALLLFCGPRVERRAAA